MDIKNATTSVKNLTDVYNVISSNGGSSGNSFIELISNYVNEDNYNDSNLNSLNNFQDFYKATISSDIINRNYGSNKFESVSVVEPECFDDEVEDYVDYPISE